MGLCFNLLRTRWNSIIGFPNCLHGCCIRSVFLERCQSRCDETFSTTWVIILFFSNHTIPCNATNNSRCQDKDVQTKFLKQTMCKQATVHVLTIQLQILTNITTKREHFNSQYQPLPSESAAISHAMNFDQIPRNCTVGQKTLQTCASCKQIP